MLPINSFQYNNDNKVPVNILLLTNQHEDSLNTSLVNLTEGFSKAYLSTKHQSIQMSIQQCISCIKITSPIVNSAKISLPSVYKILGELIQI